MRQVAIDTCANRVVVPGRIKDVEVMPDGVLKLCKRPVVEECWLERRVSQWRAAELVPIGWIAGNLFETEVLILGGPVEDHIALADTEKGCNLRHGDVVHLEIAEHLVGLAGHGVTGDALSLSGSEQETVKAYPFIEFALEASLCGCSGMPKLVSWASMFPD